MQDDLIYSWDEIVLAKLAIPELPANHVSRPYLYTQFIKGLSRRVIYVSSPAGFGKSTLLNEWYRGLLKQDGTHRPLWLTLGPEDNQGLRFWSHLVFALKKVLPEQKGDDIFYPPAPTDNSERAIQKYKVLLSNFLHQAMASTDKEYVLFLDNVDTIPGEFYVEIIDYLLTYLPSKFHIVSAGTTLPPILLDYQYSGSIYEFPTSYLAFSRQELMTFMASRYGNAASEQLIEDLYELTQGWVTGVRLFADAVETYSIRMMESLDKNFLYSLVDNYFSSYVTERAESDLSQFLICTSIVERFNYSLCDCLLERNDSQAILAELADEAFFIQPCREHSGWFEYHPLFLHWLRSQLFQMTTLQIRELASRAQDWFESKGKSNESAKYMLMGSDSDLIDSLADAAGYKRDDASSSFLIWVCSKPAKMFPQDTTLSLYAAWGYLCFGRSVDTLVWLGLFEENLAISHKVAEGFAHEQQLLVESLVIEHIKIKCREFDGHYHECIEEYKKLLDAQETISLSLRVVVLHAIAESYERIGEFGLALEYYLQTEAIADLAKSPFFVAFGRYAISWILADRGELQNAEVACRRALEDCPAEFTLYGALQALLAHILVEKNDLSSAEASMKQAMSRLSINRNADMLYEAQIIAANYTAASGNLDEAYRQIVGTVLLLEGAGLPRAVLLFAYVTQAKLALRRGSVDDASAIHEKLTQCVDQSDLFYMLRAKLIEALILFYKDDEGVLLLTDEVIGKSEAASFNTIMLEALLLKVAILDRSNNRSEALTVLNKAILMGSRLGLIRPFLDNASLLQDLLHEITNVRKAKGAKLDFLKSVLKALKARQVADETSVSEYGNDAQLTKREAEVLDLLNVGMSRQEIADALGVSHNTIKTHLNNAYSKLGVKNRSEVFNLTKSLEKK